MTGLTYGSHYHQNNYHPADHTHSLNTIINPYLNTPNMLYGLPLQVNYLIPRGKLVKAPGAIYGSESTLQNLIYELRRGNVGPQMIDEMLKPNQPTPKEPEVSTIDKIKQERREKREREELETKFQGWDEAIGHPSEGDVWTFTADLSGKTYRYAVIFTNKQWYLTGQTVCGMAGEDLIAWLIEKDVQLENFVFCEPIS